LGSPVFVKFVQYVCIAAETCRSVASYFGAFAAPPRLPKTYGTSLPCAAPAASLPGAARANWNWYPGLAAPVCHTNSATVPQRNCESVAHCAIAVPSSGSGCGSAPPFKP